MKETKPRLSRRDFLKLGGVLLLSGLAAGAGGLEYIRRVEPAWLEVTRITLKLRRLSPAFSGLKLAQISDIHMGGWMTRQRLERVVEDALAQQPDIIALTGDFLSAFSLRQASSIRNSLADLTVALRPLADTCLTVAVLGNHDHWTDAEAVRTMLRACGILDLSNHVHTLRRGDALLHFAGVDDVWEEQDRLDDVLAQLPGEAAAILLAHEPDFADTSAAAGRFDLQISGHSHGGQVSLPFVGPPILPYLGRKYPLGLYQISKMFQYTNRGVGMIDPPVRFNCRPEVTVFTLEALR